MGIIINTIKVVFLLGFLILIHELGHFLVAKKSKVAVEELSIGFGPKVFKKQGKETLYTVGIIPLGGYVKMLGEFEDTDNPNSFKNAKLRNRIAIAAAGPIVNIIFAIIVYFMLSYFTGLNISTTISGFIPEIDTSSTLLQVNDTILNIEGKKIRLKSDINKALKKSNGNEVNVTVLRNDEELTVKCIPYKYSDELYLLGIEVSLADNTFQNKVYYSFWGTIDFIESVFDSWIQLFKGNVNIKQMTGPIGISEVVVKTNEIYDFIYLLALISISLGVTNLMPIPVLDGGRILLLIIEGIRGKALKEEIELEIQSFCFMLLILFSLYVSYNDIMRIF